MILTKLSLSSTPPDILYEHTFAQDEHQPDLIKNLKAETDLHNEDKPLVTDIVGDFGKEVEEEFGVIGYNFGIFKSFEPPAIYQKTTDAALSSTIDRAFEIKTKKLISHDERSSLITLSTEPTINEATDITKKIVKQSNGPTKTYCETARNQANHSGTNNCFPKVHNVMASNSGNSRVTYMIFTLWLLDSTHITYHSCLKKSKVKSR